MGRVRFTYLSCCLLGAVIVLLTFACGPKAMQPLGWLDTPEHHTLIGVKLVEQEKYSEAGREFELALKLNPRYAKAVAGAGLIKASRGDFAGARALLEQAKQDAQTGEETLFVLAAQIRVDAQSRAACLKIGTECPREEDWLNRAKERFDRALRIDPTAAAVHYYMGECYLLAFDLEAAGRLFSRVLDLNRGYVGQADARWKLVQKIRRAMPGTLTGKKLALAERITRAEAAALFMEELQIDGRFVRPMPAAHNRALTDRVGTAAAAGPASDIAGHPLRTEIDSVIGCGIRGLGLYPDGTFRPEEEVERAAYAVMIESILIRVTGDGSLAIRFIGSRSPFSDLRVGHPSFNAAMVVTTRGIMEPEDSLTGAFAPHQPVDGAEALLAIRKIKEDFRWQ